MIFQERYDDLFRKRAGIVPAVIYLDQDFFFTGDKNRREKKKRKGRREKNLYRSFCPPSRKMVEFAFYHRNVCFELGIWTRFNIFLSFLDTQKNLGMSLIKMM